MSVYHGFRPLPFLANPHIQTILGTWLKGALLPEPRLRKVLLPDGDRLAVHDSVPRQWQAGDRVALLVHGLGGSHRSGYTARLADLLLRRGFRVVRMDLRGCGLGVRLARRTYHAGLTEDLRAAAEEIRRWTPHSPLTLIGFSLGGSMVLKLAGEAAFDPVPNLERVAAVSPPIDLEQCSDLLSLPRNRFYDRHFVLACTEQVRRHRHHFSDLPHPPYRDIRTLRLFDELYQAPQWGFANALDYYRRASSIAHIPHIQVPTLILTSRDDPFIGIEPFETLKASSQVEVEITNRGGHLGFLGWDGAGGIRWAERRIAQWVDTDVRRKATSVS